MSLLLQHQGLWFFDKATGHDIMGRLNELIRTQWLSGDELYALQTHRLRKLLDYACQYVPYYRRLFHKVGFEPGDLERDADCFKDIPPLFKAYMREHSEEFFTTEPSKRESLSQETTSGSTGHPFSFWQDRNFQDYANANTLRHHTWSGWQPGQPRAYLWPRYNHGFKARMRERARHLCWNLFFMDTNLNAESMKRLADHIEKERPQLLHGYPTPLYHFAKYVREQGWDWVKVPAVYTCSEVLYPHQREYIEQTFNCRVFNRYAAHELGGLACECEQHTGMHISSDLNYLEILDAHGCPAKEGEPGMVTVTSLTNYGFPFIRYQLADIARFSARQCACGRSQPMLEVIEGRLVDMFRTRDGRLISGHFELEAMFEVEGIVQFKMIQKSLDLVLVQLVLNNSFQRSHLDFIERTIRTQLGSEVAVKFEFPDSMPESSGRKYRYAICEIS